ncbi:hypothetical protein Desaci_4782 (plasmid) [Desulfosporosinus acidiphilus SJ4]|uniref:Uncharacterized protein n=1 Tax=Desulfosporosinus acidiphilus (strain DSM 22704 / JCM 16185 / SJ4) TaxID=646529 RepID=I4DCT2_DESAJ|nr:hypothetical protein [Desulfosporosinus acidiphilus]AFM43606.1 hypothetical protein Desaci_4782 [Desulfosporosinus acidiphilus SJ4]
MTKKSRKVYTEAQMVSDIAKESEIPIATIRKIFKTWYKVAGNEFLNNKEVPLPGGAGYIYPTLTTSKPRIQNSPLINGEVQFLPKVKTMATFSDPWKKLIHNDPRTIKLIETLLEEFKE